MNFKNWILFSSELRKHVKKKLTFFGKFAKNAIFGRAPLTTTLATFPTKYSLTGLIFNFPNIRYSANMCRKAGYPECIFFILPPRPWGGGTWIMLGVTASLLVEIYTSLRPGAGCGYGARPKGCRGHHGVPAADGVHQQVQPADTGGQTPRQGCFFF